MIITRDEAKALGLKTFFTGIPCPKGHASERFVKGLKCRQCNIEYLREYYSADREAQRKRWRDQYKVKKARDPERMRAKGRTLVKRFRDKMPLEERRKVWREEYHERYERVGADKLNEPRRKRYKADPLPALAQSHCRRARINNTGGKLKADEVRKIYVRQRARCAYDFCMKKLEGGYHIDHVIPLALGGTNDRRNIQLLCPTCNTRKGSKHPLDFARQNGLLL